MLQEAPTIVRPSVTATIDALEAELAGIEALIGQGRARQLELLRALAAASVAALDGARTMAEWTAARLDVGPETARALVRTAHRIENHGWIEARLRNGELSFDRAEATVSLAAMGADEATLADSFGLDVAGVRSLAVRRRRVTAQSEHRTHADRYVTMQPSLDENHWRLHGLLPGYEGALVAEAISEHGDRLHTTGARAGRGPAEPRAGRGQRAADGLVAMSLDSLDGSGGADDASNQGRAGRAPMISVFVDAALAAATGGEAGLELAAGPRIGPATLERLLCEGRVEVNTTGAKPLGIGQTSRVVPPRLRRFVLHRDGGCAADGCLSRYRLQAHHVVPVSEGGATDPDNLVTLCWYHHHVVVHGQGRRIDPRSGPRRIRFLRPSCGRSPP